MTHTSSKVGAGLNVFQTLTLSEPNYGPRFYRCALDIHSHLAHVFVAVWLCGGVSLVAASVLYATPPVVGQVNRMASGNLNAPHPLLTTSTLYVSDVVQELEWSHLMEVFKPCGFVRSGGKSTTSGGRTRWMVIFTDLFHGSLSFYGTPTANILIYASSLAEMALATLQGALIPDILPPFHLTLSHTSMLGSSLPNERILPQFAKGTPKAHSILSSVSPQTIFTWFRPAGPLVSVRVRVDLGFAYRTCTLEYWDENYARYARIHSRVLHPALADLKPFDLHTYDPTTLTCTVSTTPLLPLSLRLRSEGYVYRGSVHCGGSQISMKHFRRCAPSSYSVHKSALRYHSWGTL